jgi:hypothetical protein
MVAEDDFGVEFRQGAQEIVLRPDAAEHTTEPGCGEDFPDAFRIGRVVFEMQDAKRRRVQGALLPKPARPNTARS